jgi:FkbM family methyltransferase
MLSQDLWAAYVESAKVTSGSRLLRSLRSPVKTLLPPIMRRLGIKRKLDVQTIWGGVFTGVLPEAVTSEIWRSGSFELPVGLSIMKFLPAGGSYLDVGAHFGYFSLLGSHLAGADGKVLSVEATPSTFQSLKYNIENNAAFKNVALVQGAAYSERKVLEFRDFGVVASSLNSAFAARDSQNIIKSAGEAVKVQAHTVDDILMLNRFDTLDVAKIDAESSEMQVLLGMKQTLKTIRPVIIMEVGDTDPEGTSTEKLLSYLDEYGYQPYHWTGAKELAPFKKSGYLPYANLTFVPNERRL